MKIRTDAVKPRE